MLEKLPTEFDSRVKAMEVDEKPTEDYTEIGGLDKQIQELIEAVSLCACMCMLAHIRVCVCVYHSS
ncbi:hypothetical protein EON64_20960, partial [archaeon]